MRVVLVVLLALPLMAAPAVSAASTQTLDAPDIFGLEYADSPRLSPDASQVVYIRRQLDAQSDRNLGQAWLIDLESGSHQALTSGRGDHSSAHWSPEGNRIVLTGHDSDGQSQLTVLWLDSGRTSQLTRGPHAPSDPSWSPDGSRIAFNRFVAIEAPTLIKPLESPQGANWAPPPTIIDRPVFRMDGRGLLPHGQVQRFVVAATGGPPRQLTSGPFPNHGPAAWSKDGKSLVFSANRRDDHELENRDTELFRLDLESTEIQPITARYGPDEAPAVSPDGGLIAWLGFDDELLSYANQNLYI
ncbi:MAG: S9 family peptidase, partial [Xanthomonadaceae bacterium]|nr:S9 family peptidase [Xanthomonadaceae bacterium]